jgi:hypothetical protein
LDDVRYEHITRNDGNLLWCWWHAAAIPTYGRSIWTADDDATIYAEYGFTHASTSPTDFNA